MSDLTIEQANAGSALCRTLLRLGLDTRTGDLRMFFMSYQIKYLLGN